jgi:dipeptidyl aminopeptidase/acylaminoacyl peptidase
MTKRYGDVKPLGPCAAFLLLVPWIGGAAFGQESLGPGTGIDTQSIPYKIVYESLRQTDGKDNWELIMINADGSGPVNLTQTPDISEIYPHVSPDGTKICFEGEEGDGNAKVRSVYYMNIDGSNRVKVAHNARQACWGPDGQSIAFLKAEFDRYTIQDYATHGVYFYNLKTAQTTEHPNCAKLYHLYNLCGSPDGNWFLATVHGGMGFKHADLAFPAKGTDIFDLAPFGVGGCRPDFSPDGKRMTWGATDCDLCVANIDLSSGKAKVTDVRTVVKCDKEHKVYHADFSPDGRYIAFSYGPEKGNEMGGGLAPTWNICISDLTGKWVQITTDGNHNKEPDWVPAPATNR